MLNRRPRGAALAACALSMGVLSGAGARRVSAQEKSAQECCLPLLFTVGARALALADAVTARTGPGSLFVNPSLVAQVTADQFLVHNTKTSLDKSNTFTVLIHSNVAGSFALSYRLIDVLEQEQTDANGNVTGTLAVTTHQLLATYATQVVPGITAGVSYNLYQDRNDCRGLCNSANSSATTHGVDLGIQIEPPSMRYLALGASVLHLGFPLQVVNSEQASPTPLRVRAGAAYEVLHHFRPDSTIGIWASGDLITSPRDGSVRVTFGAEVSLEETIFVRAGYGTGAGFTGGGGVGVGLRYDRFDISVAKAFVSSSIDDSEPTQITFAIRF